MRGLILAALAALLLAPMARADDQTLADIRQELAVLGAEMQRLRAELSTTGGPATGLGGGTVLDRVDAIDAELRRLIGRTEALELRIERIVADGTARVRDMEFRLIELEGGDPTAAARTPPLGGDGPAVAAATPTPEAGPDSGAFLAVGERDDFDRARAAYDEGDYATAISRFAAFVEAYPGGPLTADAVFLRGQAHAELGETPQAARAFLDAFNTDPDGDRAPQALLRLGESLVDLGQRTEGCLMLDEVGFRFPGSDFAIAAGQARRDLACD